MVIVKETSNALLLDHRSAIDAHVEDSGYFCNKDLFLTTVYGQQSNLFTCVETNDATTRKRKRRKKSKHKMNIGEVKALEYYCKYGLFIETTLKTLLCEALEYFEDFKGKTSILSEVVINDLTLDIVSSGRNKIDESAIMLQSGLNIHNTIDHVLISNPLDETVNLTSQNATFLIPPKSSFILSDFRLLNQSLKMFGAKFDVVVIDPPWENKSAKRKKGYFHLPEYDLLKMDINCVIKEDSLVFVWVTNKQKYIEFVENQLFPKWGFHCVGHWHWVKVAINGECVSDLSSVHKKPYEPLLVGVKIGRKLVDFPAKKVICSIPCRTHSRKPPLNDAFSPYVGGSPTCLELFSRNLIPRWCSWGNEAIKFQDVRYFCKEEISGKDI